MLCTNDMRLLLESSTFYEFTNGVIINIRTIYKMEKDSKNNEYLIYYFSVHNADMCVHKTSINQNDFEAIKKLLKVVSYEDVLKKKIK